MSGLFGVVSESDCVEDLFYGTDYHSHLGTRFGGLAVLDGQFTREIHSIQNGQFKNLFDRFYRQTRGRAGIGVISDFEPQPIVISSRFGQAVVVTAGLITNLAQLGGKLMNEGVTFSEVAGGRLNQTELVAKIIVRGESIVAGVEDVYDLIEGSICILLLLEDGLYVARDRYGRLPIAVGQKDGAVAVANETCAFPNLGYNSVKQLLPGEIVKVRHDGLESIAEGGDTSRICAFLWIYTGYPASTYEGVSVEAVRERSGQALAALDDVEADLVSGVPDSGTGHAVGYAMASGLPFRRPLVKYSAGYGRSYVPPSQEIRDHIAKMKLLSIEDVIRGNRIILCEDSIVRGTQLKNLTLRKLWDAGAAEVHIRPACPPLMYPCRFNLSTRTPEELAARRAIRALGGAAS